MKVYSVDIGSWEDSNVAFGGIFSTKEKAEQFLREEKIAAEIGHSAFAHYDKYDFESAIIREWEVQ